MVEGGRRASLVVRREDALSDWLRKGNQVSRQTAAKQFANDAKARNSRCREIV
jgi:hypothetical protein